MRRLVSLFVFLALVGCSTSQEQRNAGHASKEAATARESKPPAIDGEKLTKSDSDIKGVAKLDSKRQSTPPRGARPRTLAEAHARAARQPNIAPSFDTKASPFGSYDAVMIFAIESRWYNLIDHAGMAVNATGRAVVSFRLHQDGRITNLEIKERTVSKRMAQLCLDAIHDPAPYKEWPDEMRSLNGKDFRDLAFTFFYN